MTYEEVRQQRKNQALRTIMRMYSKPFPMDRYDPDSYGEQRDFAVANELGNMNQDIKALKIKHKKLNDRSTKDAIEYDSAYKQWRREEPDQDDEQWLEWLEYEPTFPIGTILSSNGK